MAGRGPTPKAEPLGHRTKAELATKELATEADRPRPVLAPSYRCELKVHQDGKILTEAVTRRFLQETKDWWDDWCSSAQAEEFTVTSWRRLRMLAPIVDQFHRTGDSKLMAEIRQNEAKLGATLEDMQRLRLKPAEKAKPESKAKPQRRLKVV